jgi:predicted amidohydrolase
MENLKVTLVQSELNWHDKASNFMLFDHLLESNISETDLIVLPEMFTTGFTMKAEDYAETMDGDTVSWLKDQAKRFDSCITGSAIIEEDGSYYNRLLWVTPDGNAQHYDKRHRFSLAGEQNHYSAGSDRKVFELKGWKIFPQICFDLRFPVFSRNDLEYDLAFYIANWPERRSHAWRTLLPARAIENQSYVIGVNRVGKDGNDVLFRGDSGLFDPLGKMVSKIKPHEETVQTFQLNAEELKKVREKFKFLNDRDQFEIKL